MPRYGYPADDYTPHGYLANPYAVAHSWSDGEGGCLRSSRSHLGVGWQLPWALQAKASAELVVILQYEMERFVVRADFAQWGLFSPHHSSQLLTYRWQAFGLAWDASFVQIDASEIGVHIVCSPLPGSGDHGGPATVHLTIGAVGWRHDGNASVVEATGGPAHIDLGPEYGRIGLFGDNAWTAWPTGHEGVYRIPPAHPAAWWVTAPGQVAIATDIQFAASKETVVNAIMRRLPVNGESLATRSISATVGQAIGRARRDDDAFWSKAARLVGDWPHHWRRGWVYDLETTRMCIYPAGGVFTDVWPAWMIQWPRAVVAEGTLDLARLAYADPQLALRAALSLFRDTTADNIPCIFQHGEPNMVAADGSVCGTSPAWCVPFYNLERLYRMTLDRDWLAAIYPHLARYVEWWLRERTDAEGWAVYKCTWEAGEDDTPRLDPERRGDNVVSQYVRPVELQATMALSASVLARFAETLGKPDEASRWTLIEAAFGERTRFLWDASEGRFRDWDARANAFLAPAAGEAEQTNYWGIDPCRYSALAFTPVLAGLADEAHRDGLRRELRHYGKPPWTLWASWSYVVLEAAHRLSERAWAGQIAASIVDRVYRELDAREISAPNHPTPGVAREYWPLDLDTWASSEGYGWGANTASMLIRQVFGFVESSASQDLTFTLAPNLPAEFLEIGRTYLIANLPYRGTQLSVGYRVESTGTATEPPRLSVLLAADVPTSCAVVPLDGDGPLLVVTRPPAARHTVPGHNGARYEVVLQPAASS